MKRQEEQEVIDAINHEFRIMSSMALYNNLIWWATGKEYREYELNKAFEMIDRVFLEDFKDEFLTTVPQGTIFYRARRIESKDYGNQEKGLDYDRDRFYGYNWEESKEPPRDIASAGRNSRKGETALYLATEAITACVECRPRIRQLVSVAEFQLEEDFQVIDFSKLKYATKLDLKDEEYNADTRYLLSRVLALFTQPVYGNDYVITQKIIDHFRDKDYKGFAYRSFYTDGTNYTFFDESTRLFKWKDSRIFLNYALSNLFITLDNDNIYGDMDNKYMLEKKISPNVRQDIIHDTQCMFRENVSSD